LVLHQNDGALWSHSWLKRILGTLK
jgi:hypothetical protein